MLVNTKLMLRRAQRNGYAVGHFNTSNIEFTRAIVEAAEKLNAPVIVAASKSAINHAGIDNLSLVVRNIAKKSKVPVALHLDHGPTLDLAKDCIKNQFTSLMIDASKLSFNENVKITKQVVNLAHRRRITVESELGRLQGIEGWVKVSAREAAETDPEDARKFVSLTKCDSLAVAVGTSHGAYKFSGKSHLDIKRLKEIRNEVDVPLVLHGASAVYQDVLKKTNKFGAKIKNAHGVSDSDIRKAIKAGICKVNTDTDLRIAFDYGIRKYLSENKESINYRAMIGSGRDEVQKMVERRIKVFGSSGII